MLLLSAPAPMRTLARLLPVILALSLPACGARRGPAPEVVRTTLTVRNDNYLDHNIYLIVGTDRIRIGTARGLTTTRFTIPRQYLFGVSVLQFLADPIGGRANSISERISVSPGDEVELVIRPQRDAPAGVT